MPASDLMELLSGVKRKQLSVAEHGARLILAAVAATGRAPLTKRQFEELPNLRKLAAKYPDHTIPIAVILIRFPAKRVLPSLMFKGFARWVLDKDGMPGMQVKEVGEP